MISILLHKQNLNLVIFGWTELIQGLQITSWTSYYDATTNVDIDTNNFIGTHATRKSPSSVSYANRPLRFNRGSRTLITATSLLLHESRSWSLNQGKLTLRFQGPPLGGRSQRRSHTQKHGTYGAHTSGWLSCCCFSLEAYGAAILLIHRIPIELTNPPFCTSFYSQGSISSAVFILVLVPSWIYHRA